jgi:hypothetical protein
MWFNLDEVAPSVLAKAKALARKAKNQPVQKEIAETFCGEVVDVTKRDQLGAVTENIQKCACPRGKNCKDVSMNDGVIQFLGKKGFTDPYKHLLACPFKGKTDEQVMLCYWVAKVYQRE